MMEPEIETPQLDDLTRLDMDSAGIDTEKVTRGDRRLGEEWYQYIDGNRRIVFGPGVDVSNGTTLGWDTCTYERVDGDWDPLHQDWDPTKQQMLETVRRRIGPGAESEQLET